MRFVISVRTPRLYQFPRYYGRRARCVIYDFHVFAYAPLSITTVLPPFNIYGISELFVAVVVVVVVRPCRGRSRARKYLSFVRPLSGYDWNRRPVAALCPAVPFRPAFCRERDDAVVHERRSSRVLLRCNNRGQTTGSKLLRTRAGGCTRRKFLSSTCGTRMRIHFFPYVPVLCSVVARLRIRLSLARSSAI